MWCLTRFRQALPLVAQRERVMTEALDLMKEATESSSCSRFATTLSQLRTRAAALTSQIRELLPVDDEEAQL